MSRQLKIELGLLVAGLALAISIFCIGTCNSKEEHPIKIEQGEKF